MSVTPGSKIAFSDLQALATLANAKSSLSFNVSPLGLDGSGNPYGYQRFSGVFIYAAGINYKPGDSLSLGFGSVFTVEMVSSTGGVLGIRYENFGVGLYSDSASSPASASGGSGSGCQLGFSFGQYGPTAAYDFGAMGLGLDFDPTLGNVTDYYIVDGGAGYAVGNTLGFTEQPTTVLTVATVDGSGKILTFTKTTGTSAIVIPQNVASMNATGGAGTGAKFGGYFTLAQKPQWLTELNRLRGNLDGLNLTGKFGGVTTCNSGPWPGGPTASFKDTNFYYPDTGNVESVTLANQFANSSGPFTTATREQAFYPGDPNGMWSLKTFIFLNHIEATILIGGVDPVLVTGDFLMNGTWVRGGVWSGSTMTPDGVDPTSLIHVSGNFPGTLSVTYSGSGTPLPDFSNFTNILSSPILIKYSVSQYLNPGRYKIIVDVDIQTDDTYGTQSDDYVPVTQTSVMFDATISQENEITGGATAGFVYHTATDYPGIHNTKGIKKIQVPGDGIGAGGGIYCVNQYPTNSWQTTPYPQPTFGPENIYAFGMGITTSVAGLWTAYCQMVSSLNPVTPGNMPWNLQRTKYGSSGQATVNPSLLGDLAANISNVAEISNSYDQSLPVESQVELPGWIASRYFTIGFNIVDGNGNFQIVTTAGITGASAPTWPTTENGTVTDGTVHWNCRRVLAATAAWSTGAKTLGSAIKDSNGNTQVVTTAGTSAATAPTWATMDGQTTVDGSVIWEKRSPFSPVQHRAQAVPVYPFYWQGNNALPTTWVAATAYALNATVIDANGNTQQCTTAGTSAATAPVWSLTLAGVTSDGATLKWTLITLAAETSAFLKPPTATSGLTRWGANDQWQRNNWGGPYGSSYDAGWQYDNLAMGWWIYSVSINRMVQNPASQVAVTIGCIRNGSFVAFGTWNTGQTIQVLWPVFTSDALVYQCGERVDIQAVAIASVGAGVSTGATASGYPICAAFVSDTTALLNLL